MKELKFSIFTDVHYDPAGEIDSSKGIKGEESVRNFPLLVDKLKKINLDFAVNLGDLVESEPEKSFPFILRKLQQLSCRSFHVVGNHELELLSKKDLKKVFGLKSFHYSVEMKGYKLIFLDSFDMKSSKLDSRRKSRIIGGPISKKQIDWLEKELRSTKGKAIIFSHKLLSDQKLDDNPIWSIAPERYTKVENARDVRQVLEKSKKVLAVFSGHVHQNSMVKIKGIPYFTIQGFCQSRNYSPKQKASQSYALVNIGSDSVFVDVKGDEKSYRIKV